jgi:hypothetical protein
VETLWLLGKRLFWIGLVVVMVVIATSALIDNDAVQEAIVLGVGFTIGVAGVLW